MHHTCIYICPGSQASLDVSVEQDAQLYSIAHATGAALVCIRSARTGFGLKASVRKVEQAHAPFLHFRLREVVLDWDCSAPSHLHRHSFGIKHFYFWYQTFLFWYQTFLFLLTVMRCRYDTATLAYIVMSCLCNMCHFANGQIPTVCSKWKETAGTGGKCIEQYLNKFDV